MNDLENGSMMDNNKVKRNIIIYIVGVLVLSAIGGVLVANKHETGMLIFIVGPVLMMVLLRYFGGDGFKDAGLSLKLKESWGWYLLCLFAPPVTILIVIVLGIVFGVTSLKGDADVFLPLILMGMAAQLVPRFIFSLCEELGWRGYLEPRLSALGVPDLGRHLFVGFIWAIWHFPLILSTNYTDISYAIFFPMFVIGIMLSAIVYGQIRKASKTVWTSVLLHGMGNTVVWSIIQNDLISFNNKILAYPAPESVFMMVIWGVLAWYLYSSLSKK